MKGRNNDLQGTVGLLDDRFKSHVNVRNGFSETRTLRLWADSTKILKTFGLHRNVTRRRQGFAPGPNLVG